MKFRKFKKIVQLASMVFTGIVVLELVAGQELLPHMLWGLLACAVAASLIRVCLFQESLFEGSVWCQAVYLVCVWVTGILCNYLFGWGLAWKTTVSILAEVLIIYFVLRLVNYQFVKSEVKRMNKRLEKSGRGKEDKPSG